MTARDAKTPALASCLPDLADALARDGGPGEATVRAFVASQRRVGLLQGERPICPVLSPLVLSSRTYHRVASAAALVMRALERVASRAPSDPALADVLGIPPRERALHAVDPGYPSAVVVGRLDMVFTAGPADEEPPFSFLELNADSPAGIADQRMLEDTLFQIPLVRTHLAAIPALRLDPAEGLLAAVRETYRRWGGDGDPRVAIVDWPRVDTLTEQEALCRLFRAAGVPATLAAPDDLRYAGDRLTAHGAPVDVVYRRVIARELLEHVDDDHPLLRAYRDHVACVINPFRSTIVNRKAAFAVLSDPAWTHLFTEDERAALRRHVPWSRVLRADDAALRAALRGRQDDLVLKPNDDYGAKGVTLGWTVEPATWATALERAAAGGGLVQERVHPRRLGFPAFSADGGVHWPELGFDCDPFMFLGRMEGAMVRVSSSPLSNVSAGGGVTALLVRDDGPSARVHADV